MRELIRRKRRLVLETPFRVRGRPVIVDVQQQQASGLRLREKGRRSQVEISWAGSGLQPGVGDRSGACPPGKARKQKRYRTGPRTGSSVTDRPTSPRVSSPGAAGCETALLPSAPTHRNVQVMRDGISGKRWATTRG